MGVPINNVPRRVVFAASGTGPYAFTFEILAATDIAVYRDDTLLTLTTNYTVTINANGTGYVTLTATPTGATQIAIVGNRTIQRTTDFVTGGDFFANTVNDEMDQQTIFAQQNAEGLARALSAPQTDPTSINMTLPRASLRANKVLGFDANGNPAIADTLGTNRGNWASGTLYYVRDIVKDTTNNNIWQCLVLHTSSGSQPINTNADSAKWSLLVDAASASTSASNAASSASAAATSASNAATSESNAASSASTATTQASNASTSATNAANSASTASTQATNAANSASAAAASYDSFDDRYLGAKASDPTVDNDGNSLIDGALYFDTTNNVMKVYDLGNTLWKRTTPTTTDQANIDAAVANATNINTVAGISANVTTVAGISGNVTTVAGNSANVTTVAGISANVTTVATNNANVTTVATNIASVNTNATNIANINQNAANITAIQNASANATSAAASATTATTQAANAAASAAAASAVVLGNEPVRSSMRPSLLLDFANTRTLDPRITFTRASTATYYDGKTTAKAEENFLLQSQDFTTTWTTASQNSTITSNTAAAPDGTTTADTLTDNATSGVHRVAQTVTTSNTNQLVLSCFLKYSTMQWVALSAATNTGQWASAKFDIQNGVLGSTSQQGTGWTANSSSITSVGNGWYRCVVVFTPGNSGSLGVYVSGATDGTTFTTSQRGSEVYSGTGKDALLWGAQLEQRSAATTYTATTTQPITNYIPQLLTAASGVARFDSNPTTSESLGMLVEEQRTNLILQSETFATTWATARAAISANAVVSPAGTLTADLFIADTQGDPHFITQSVTTTATATTFSVYAKAAGKNFLALQISDSGGAGRVTYFNLSTGAVGTTGVGITASIVAVGNGWYRCAATVATALAGSNNCYVFVADVDGSLSFTGNDYSGICIWGAQLEAGAFPTSYIPTTTAQVTRSADVASMTGTNFSGWYNVTEGTLYAEFRPVTADFGANKNIFLVGDGTTSNYVGFRFTSVGTQPTLSVVTGGVAQVAITTGTMVAGTSYKIAGVYKANDFAITRNSGTVGTDTLGSVPVVDRAEINALAGANSSSLYLSKLAYYPKRLTNAELQSITTV